MKKLILLFGVIAVAHVGICFSAAWAQQCRNCNPNEAATEGGNHEGVLIRETMKVKQNAYLDNATDLHFKLWQKEEKISINGWRVCITDFGSAKSSRGVKPGGDPTDSSHAVDVDAWAGSVPYNQKVHIYACFWLTSYNTKRIADVVWTKSADTTKACPDFGWTVDHPVEGEGGIYKHLIKIYNDDPDSTLILQSLALLADSAFIDSLDTITFAISVPNLPDTIGPGEIFAYDMPTFGSFKDGHIYAKFIIKDPLDSNYEVEDIFDHPVTIKEVPSLTEWGLIILLVIMAGIATWVVLKRRRVVTA